MVTKKKRTGADANKGGVKVRNLKLNRETVKDLSASEKKQIKGGILISLGGVSDFCQKR